MPALYLLKLCETQFRTKPSRTKTGGRCTVRGTRHTRKTLCAALGVATLVSTHPEAALADSVTYPCRRIVSFSQQEGPSGFPGVTRYTTSMPIDMGTLCSDGSFTANVRIGDNIYTHSDESEYSEYKRLGGTYANLVGSYIVYSTDPTETAPLNWTDEHEQAFDLSVEFTSSKLDIKIWRIVPGPRSFSRSTLSLHSHPLTVPRKHFLDLRSRAQCQSLTSYTAPRYDPHPGETGISFQQSAPPRLRYTVEDEPPSIARLMT